MLDRSAVDRRSKEGVIAFLKRKQEEASDALVTAMMVHELASYIRRLPEIGDWQQEVCYAAICSFEECVKHLRDYLRPWEGTVTHTSIKRRVRAWAEKHHKTVEW